MPYAPAGVTDQTAAYNLQGNQAIASTIGSLGQMVAQGITEYKGNQKANNAAQAVVASTIANNPSLLEKADDKTRKLFEKFKAGNTGLEDNTYLAGWLATGQQQQHEANARTIANYQLSAQKAEADAATNLGAMSQLLDAYETKPDSLTPEQQNRAKTLAGNQVARFAIDSFRMNGKAPSADVLGRYAEHTETVKAAKAAAINPNNIQIKTLNDGTKIITGPKGDIHVQSPPPDKGQYKEGDISYSRVPGKSARKLIWENNQWKDFETRYPLTVNTDIFGARSGDINPALGEPTGEDNQNPGLATQSPATRNPDGSITIRPPVGIKGPPAINAPTGLGKTVKGFIIKAHN